jgi:hypothetical protein
MKLNSISIIRTVSTSIIALLFMAGINNLAMADNAAALKDSIKTNSKVAEARTTDMKEIDSLAKAPADDDFKKLDANKDGKISLKEAVKDKALASSFDATDEAASAVKSSETAPAAN